MRSLLPCVSVLALLYAAPLTAQDIAAQNIAAQNTTDDEFANRLRDLESETRALHAEVEWLRNNPVRLPQIMATPTSLLQSVPPPLDVQSDQPVSNDEDFYSIDDLREEMKKLAWTKGDFRIVPYGFLWGNTVYQTERTNPGSYTLFVLSPDVQGEDEFVIDGRNTRIGIDVAGPRLQAFGCAKSGGKVEFDFQGNFAGTENRGGVLLRHAYWEIKNEDFRFVAGQTWDVIAPLNPGTIMYSVCWAGGNIGYRRAQLRYERYMRFSDTFMLTAQASINSNIVSDHVNAPGVGRGPAAYPLVEGRLATTLGSRDGYIKPITLGVSGHIGEQIYDLPANVPAGLPAVDDLARRTWSFNFDMQIPITERLGVKGEYFVGSNITTFLGGILQGVNLDTRRTIGTTGGWISLWYDLTDDWQTNVGWGLDDPFNQDLITVAGGAGPMRNYNQFIFANLVYNVTDKFTMGFEVSSWETHYTMGRRPGEAVRFEYMGKYAF